MLPRSGLRQLQGGFPVFLIKGAKGQQPAGIGVGLKLMAADRVAQGKGRLAGFEIEDALAPVVVVSGPRGAKQSKIAPTAAAPVSPILHCPTGGTSYLIGASSAHRSYLPWRAAGPW
jgi:hypothetical protein